jgi:phosphocarrier protein HPr
LVKFQCEKTNPVSSPKEVSREVIVVNELGLHARSAAQLARLAQNCKGGVWLQRDDQRVDATSIMDILSLACAKGTRIRVIIDNPAEIDVLDRIVQLVESGFGE